ncbi:MAG: MazG nucleotide pyrophosphohydrolase domain-containing protein, partial [Vicinamibacterales bacterium]
ARFSEQVGEELGDVLWYVANIAHKVGLSLGEIAEKNLDKTRRRWLKSLAPRALFDAGYPAHEQLPRDFEYTFVYRTVDGIGKIILMDEDGKQVGAALT